MSDLEKQVRLMDEAARYFRDGPNAEVAALRARIAELEAALRTIGYGPPRVGNPLTLLNTFISLARAALKETKG